MPKPVPIIRTISAGADTKLLFIRVPGVTPALFSRVGVCNIHMDGCMKGVRRHKLNKGDVNDDSFPKFDSEALSIIEDLFQLEKPAEANIDYFADDLVWADDDDEEFDDSF